MLNIFIASMIIVSFNLYDYFKAKSLDENRGWYVIFYIEINATTIDKFLYRLMIYVNIGCSIYTGYNLKETLKYLIG